VSGDFGAPGDSGSLVVTQNTADPVALLYGGSDVDAVANPVAPVLSFFSNGVNTATFAGGGAPPGLGCLLPQSPRALWEREAGAAVDGEPSGGSGCGDKRAESGGCGARCALGGTVGPSGGPGSWRGNQLRQSGRGCHRLFCDQGTVARGYPRRNRWGKNANRG